MSSQVFKLNVNPVFFAPRLSKISTDPNDFFERWTKYSHSLSLVSSGTFTSINMIVRIQNSKHLSQETTQSSHINLTLLNPSSKGFLRDYVNFWRILKSNDLFPNIVIAGDNYLGFLIPFLYRLISNSSFRIQISIHNSLKPIIWRKFNLKNYLKQIGLYTIVLLADSIRTVSNENREYLVNIWRVPPFKILVAPIPVLIPDLNPNNVEDYSIGFLGRMHEERGIEPWVRIIERYARDHQDIKVLIAGDGIMRNNFLSGLSKILPERQVVYLGSLPNSGLEIFWQSCSVLLSTAENESYGMAIREGILNGRKVVAYSNSGTREIQKIFPGAIFLYSDEEDAIRRIGESFEKKLTRDEVESFRRKQREENQRSLKSLVESWL